MKNIYYVFKKELKSYFVSPLAYTVVAVFLFITGYFFYVILANTHDASLRILFGNMSIILLLISPVLTMRLVAEERKLGTDEFLLTAPLKSVEVVLGKYFAAVCLFLFMAVLSLEYFIVLKHVGDPEMGPIYTGYFGLMLLGATYCAVGIFTSALSDNQMVSAMLGFGILLMFWVIDWFSSVASPAWSRFLNSLSMLSHFDSFQKGVIDTTDLFYFFAIIFLFLFITTKLVESKRR